MAALLVYKRVSNQQAIARVKSRMQASLFEIRLFNDDLRAILRAQGGFLLGNLRYLALNLVPLLWLIIPFVLVFVHLEPRYRYQGLEADATAIVKARLSEEAVTGATGKPVLTLEAPAGLRVTSPPVWNTGRREMVWRIEADQPGAYRITVVKGGDRHAKEIRFSDRTARFSVERPAGGWIAELAHPGERPLPGGSGLETLSVLYSERDWGRFPGTDIAFAWWFWWLVLMVAFGLLLRKPMGVEI